MGAGGAEVGPGISSPSTGGGGSGTVTSVSVASANGLAGTVANPTTTPALTLSTTVTGLLKGNGTAVSAAVAGTDYTVSVTAADGSIVIGGSAGAVTVQRGALTGDATAAAGSNAVTVGKINGTALSGLATGLLKNTTGTGVPSIAVAGTDYLAPAGSGAALTGITVAQVSGAAPLASPALTGVPTAPTAAAGDNSTQIATDAFVTTAVNNAIAGVNPAVAVQAATVAAADTSGLTYSNGVGGIGATFTGAVNTPLTVDGFTFTALGQRLLVKNDTQAPSGAFNGIYNVTQIQTAIVPPILTRALDYDTPSDMNNTGAIPVVSGTVNATTSWVLTSQVVTVGTTPLTFTKFSLAPSTIQTGPLTADVTTVGTAATLVDTVNTEAIARVAAIQAARRQGSASWDNVPLGTTAVTQVAAASNGQAINALTAATLNVIPIPVGTFADQITHVTAAPLNLTVNTSAGNAQALYTGVTISGGNIVAFTGISALGGATGTVSTGGTVYGPPQAVCDVVVCADSILYAQGSNIVNQNAAGATTDWFAELLARENRAAGLPDPGRGWRRAVNGTFGADQWTTLAGGANSVGSVGPSTNAAAANCYTMNTLNAISGDTFSFRRSVVHIQQQTNGAGIQVSFNGGSTFTSTIDGNGSGLITVDSGDLGNVQQRVIQVKQVAAVTGTGAAGVLICGHMPFQTDGTSGVVGYNFAQPGTTTAQWITPTGWDTIWLPYLQPRRVYKGLGLNDLNTAVSLATISANETTLVQRTQKASPLTEIVECAMWHVGANGVGGTNAFNTGITNANWSTFVNTIAAVALANNCTFEDLNAWMGDAAIWNVAAVTTTNGGASATVASGGFPGWENGMLVTGVGMPAINQLGGVRIASIVGNTVNFSGNTAAIVGGTVQLTATNDTRGISAQDGVHFGDSVRSTSGKNAQQGLAESFYLNGSYYKADPANAAGPGWTIDTGGYPLDKTGALCRVWTRTSNTTFTINYPTTLVGIYTKGTRLRWAEAGVVKYGVVASSSFSAATLLTTVTMIATSDFVMAANPDTGSNWYSYGNPAGFPVSFAWSPTITGGSNGGTFLGQWNYTAGLMTATIIQVVAVTSNATTMTCTNLPLAANGSQNCPVIPGTDNATATTLSVQVTGGTTTATFGKVVLGGVFTASSTKGPSGPISYFA